MTDEDVERELDAAYRQSVEAMDAAHGRGELTPEEIAAAIREHRRRHPYRFDPGPVRGPAAWTPGPDGEGRP